MQPDNRLLTNLIKCEKEHHSALLALLVRSHTSLAALSAYASAAAPPVAQALLGCIQAFAAADEGLRGYAAAVEGWKKELKEVKRVEDEYKAVVKDKEILVGRLIKASKQKIPTSSLQAGPAPIPNASYLAPSSPSSSSYPLPTSQPYQYTPTPHATQHINSKLALAQRELHACEAHLASKEAELAEVRRSAITEGMARRCRAMADVAVVWRERGEHGMRALDGLSQEAAGAAPPQQPFYTPPRHSFSSHSGSSIAPSHSASQQRHTTSLSQSPFSPNYAPPRSQSPMGYGGAVETYQTLSGGYQHSHPLLALPERGSWHVDREHEEDRARPVTYHPDSHSYPDHAESSRRPMSLIEPPRAPRATLNSRRPVSSHDLPLPPDEEPVTLDIPPPHSIGDGGEFIPVGRPVSSLDHLNPVPESGALPTSESAAAIVPMNVQGLAPYDVNVGHWTPFKLRIYRASFYADSTFWSSLGDYRAGAWKNKTAIYSWNEVNRASFTSNPTDVCQSARLRLGRLTKWVAETTTGGKLILPPKS